MKAIKCCRPKKKIVIERRMSNAGQMEEVYTEKEQTPEFIPNVIRRLSAIDSIVNEARIYSRRNTLASSNNSDKDNESHRNVRRRSIISNEVEANTEEKSNFHLFYKNPSTFLIFFDSLLVNDKQKCTSIS